MATVTTNNTSPGYGMDMYTVTSTWLDNPSYGYPQQWIYPSPPVNPGPPSSPQITSFGGKAATMRDLPQGSLLAIGLCYFVEDIEAVVVWSGSGWVTYMSTYPSTVRLPPSKRDVQDEQEVSEADKLWAPPSKDVTRWPPRD